MSEQKIITVKFFEDSLPVIVPDEDTPLFQLGVTEPPTPTSSYFTYKGTKYMVAKCIPYKDKDGKEAWMATVKEIQILGVGANIPNFNPKSKIWGENAERLQRTRERLQARGIDTDILEEMGDITKLTDSEIDELATMSQAIKPLPPKPEELKTQVDTLKTEKVDVKRQTGLIDKLVAKGLLTQAEADELKNVQ